MKKQTIILLWTFLLAIIFLAILFVFLGIKILKESGVLTWVANKTELVLNNFDYPKNKMVVYESQNCCQAQLAPDSATINYDLIYGKWINKNVFESEDYKKYTMPYFEYFPDSSFINNQLDYSDKGTFWISEGYIYEVWSPNDTDVSQIIKLDGSDLVVINEKSDKVFYKRHYVH